MRARFAFALSLLTLTGCTKSAQDYLSERVRTLPDAEPDAEQPDAALPVGPDVLDLRRIPIASVEEPRGLAHDGRHLFTTDRADDTLVRLDPISGAEVDRIALPARGALGLTALGSEILLVAYEDTIYRLEGQRFSREDGVFSDVAGLVAADADVITAHTGSLYVRDRDSLAARLQLDYRGEPGPLVRLGADYLIYDLSRRLDGLSFTARFTVADALSVTSAAERGSVDLPIDVARVTGVTALGDALWVVGSGQGGDAGQVVVLTLSREAGR